jgi:hypothetical protein
MRAIRSWWKLGTVLTLALPLCLAVSGCSDDDGDEEGDDEVAKMAVEVEVTMVHEEGAATDETTADESASESAVALEDHSADVSEEPSTRADD